MENVIALLDDEGIPANKLFWKKFFSIIGFSCEETTNDLDLLTRLSNSVFPTSVCTNSKVRLGNAILLANKVSHFLFFLRNDKYVNNCPASVYRIRWVKEQFPNVKTIIWPHDLDVTASFEENLINLAKKLVKLSPTQEKLIRELKVPKRKPVYIFPSNNGRQKLLLIGVSPHSIDPYRKTEAMNYLMNKFNVYSPMTFCKNTLSLKERTLLDTIYFKEDAIRYAIDKALESGIEKFLLVSDPLDIPGNFTFPIIKQYLEKKGISKFKEGAGEKTYLELKASYKNEDFIKSKLDEFY